MRQNWISIRCCISQPTDCCRANSIARRSRALSFRRHLLRRQAQPTDGLLTASEISELRLNADLVVLSACNTAASGGTALGGGALEGLADAFFAAGARAVLASHWEVPSAATQKLMTGVFARYAKDPSRDLAEALRQSQLALIAQPATAHPFNWAAFTLIGDGGTATHTADTHVGRVTLATGE